MDNTVACSNVSSDNLGHITSRVGSSLLVNVSTNAHSSTFVSIDHGHCVGTLEIFGVENLVNRMEKKNILEEFYVSKNSVEKISQFLKCFVSGSKDGEFSSGQGVCEPGLSNGCA
jgi:hypothetical protein